MLKITSLPDQADKAADPREINMSDLGEDERAEWQRSRDFLNQHISNYVHILVYNQCSDPTRDILLTPAGKYEGGTQVGGRAKFVGIVWDSRVMGESSARPSVRMPPLQIMEVHKLFECIRSRHDRSSETTKVLHPYDLYISIAGGRDLGSQYQRWFASTGPPTPVTRCVHVLLDPVSVQNRCEKVRGIASNRSHDVMRLTAAPWPKQDLKTAPRLHYRGTSASDSIGPVALNQIEYEEA